MSGPASYARLRAKINGLGCMSFSKRIFVVSMLETAGLVVLLLGGTAHDPAVAKGQSVKHLICNVENPSVASDAFSGRLCAAMADAFDSKLAKGPVKSVAKDMSGTDVLMELEVTLKQSGMRAVLRGGTVDDWLTGKQKTSDPVDVTVMDAGLSDGTISNLAGAAGFLAGSLK